MTTVYVTCLSVNGHSYQKVFTSFPNIKTLKSEFPYPGVESLLKHSTLDIRIVELRAALSGHVYTWSSYKDSLDIYACELCEIEIPLHYDFEITLTAGTFKHKFNDWPTRHDVQKVIKNIHRATEFQQAVSVIPQKVLTGEHSINFGGVTLGSYKVTPIYA